MPDGGPPPEPKNPPNKEELEGMPIMALRDLALADGLDPDEVRPRVPLRAARAPPILLPLRRQPVAWHLELAAVALLGDDVHRLRVPLRAARAPAALLCFAWARPADRVPRLPSYRIDPASRMVVLCVASPWPYHTSVLQWGQVDRAMSGRNGKAALARAMIEKFVREEREAREVALGLGRTVALHRRPSASYQIC